MCVLKPTDLQPDVPVEIAINLRSEFRSKIRLEPTGGITEKNGKFEFTIIAVSKGIDLVAWAVKNNKGKFEFNKKHMIQEHLGVCLLR